MSEPMMTGAAAPLPNEALRGGTSLPARSADLQASDVRFNARLGGRGAGLGTVEQRSRESAVIEREGKRTGCPRGHSGRGERRQGPEKERSCVGKQKLRGAPKRERPGCRGL